MGRNHRSSARIVAAAASLIGNNTERLAKEVSARRPGPRLEVWSCADGAAEAQAIAVEAERLLASGVAAGDVAVLCRTNAIARPIAEALAARGLPHVVVGGQGLLDRPEVRDVIAMLRVVLDPGDAIASFRVLDLAPSAVVAELHAMASTTDVRDLFFELMNRTRYLDGASDRVAANVSQLSERINEYCEHNADHSLEA